MMRGKTPFTQSMIEWPERKFCVMRSTFPPNRLRFTPSYMAMSARRKR